MQGGHRVGITGNVAMKEGKIINVNYVSSLNFRVAREIIGASDSVLKEVLVNNEINNTLIVSKPRMWKNYCS